MFTQKLTAWREKQRPETAWFQGKIQVEKSGGNLGHIYRVTPQQHLSPLAASSDEGGHFHCNHNVFTRFGRTQRTAPPSQGAGWGTPGSRVGSIVEQPRGVGWRTLGSKVEEHRAVHTTPQGKESSGQIRRSISARNRIRRRTKWGAPVSRRAPLSTAVCVRRQSSSLRLSQRRS